MSAPPYLDLGGGGPAWRVGVPAAAGDGGLLLDEPAHGRLVGGRLGFLVFLLGVGGGGVALRAGPGKMSLLLAEAGPDMVSTSPDCLHIVYQCTAAGSRARCRCRCLRQGLTRRR